MSDSQNLVPVLKLKNWLVHLIIARSFLDKSVLKICKALITSACFAKNYVLGHGEGATHLFLL